MTKELYRILSYTCYIPVLANYAVDYDTEGKRKIGQLINPSPCGPSFLLNKSKEEYQEHMSKR